MCQSYRVPTHVTGHGFAPVAGLGGVGDSRWFFHEGLILLRNKGVRNLLRTGSYADRCLTGYAPVPINRSRRRLNPPLCPARHLCGSSAQRVRWESPCQAARIALAMEQPAIRVYETPPSAPRQAKSLAGSRPLLRPAPRPLRLWRSRRRAAAFGGRPLAVSGLAADASRIARQSMTGCKDRGEMPTVDWFPSRSGHGYLNCRYNRRASPGRGARVGRRNAFA